MRTVKTTARGAPGTVHFDHCHPLRLSLPTASGFTVYIQHVAWRRGDAWQHA